MSAGNPYDTPAAPLEAGAPACASCGAPLSAAAAVCPACGARQPARVDKATLLLLTFFFGGVGAHKFYLGKHVQGFLYALFCWTLIPGAIALVELLIYACSSRERLNRRYQVHASALLVAAGCAAFFAVLFGLMAYLALSAYSDYQARTKVADTLGALSSHKLAVDEYRRRNGRFPEAGSESPARDTPVPHTRAVRMARGGAIVAEFNGDISQRLDGQAIVLVPGEGNGELRWRCGVREAALANYRLLPSSCRELIAPP